MGGEGGVTYYCYQTRVDVDDDSGDATIKRIADDGFVAAIRVPAQEREHIGERVKLSKGDMRLHLTKRDRFILRTAVTEYMDGLKRYMASTERPSERIPFGPEDDVDRCADLLSRLGTS
jgi:hypothetical protein